MFKNRSMPFRVMEVLIKGVMEHAFWRKLYVLSDRSLFKVKQFMENHIWVEASLFRHGPPYFYKDNKHQLSYK
jgi:hypothetical protein